MEKGAVFGLPDESFRKRDILRDGAHQRPRAVRMRVRDRILGFNGPGQRAQSLLAQPRQVFVQAMVLQDQRRLRREKRRQIPRVGAEGSRLRLGDP